MLSSDQADSLIDTIESDDDSDNDDADGDTGDDSPPMTQAVAVGEVVFDRACAGYAFTSIRNEDGIVPSMRPTDKLVVAGVPVTVERVDGHMAVLTEPDGTTRYLYEEPCDNAAEATVRVSNIAGDSADDHTVHPEA